MDKTLRILILEDNPADAELIQFELHEEGIIFTARVVMMEKDYIQGLQTFSPDIILSDYDLPRYTGSLALAEARRRCPDVPFILVTGAVSEDRAIEILTSGAKDYVMKNRLGRLAPAIRRALAEAEEHKARKMAEEEVHAASLYSRTLIEASLDPLVTISPDGKVMDVNKATEQVIGVPRDQIIGTDFADYFTEPQKARAGYKMVFSTGSVRGYPLALRHISGRITEVLYNLTTYTNEKGEVKGVFAAARDVTELKKAEKELRETHSDLEENVRKRTAALEAEIEGRKQIEKALRESEERQRLVLQSSSMGTFEFNLLTGEGRWNATEFELLGLLPGEVTAGPDTFFRFVHPDDVGLLRSQWEEAMRTGRLETEFRIVRADGRERWLAGKGGFIFEGKPEGKDPEAGGKAIRFIGVNFDITERRKAVEDMHQLLAVIREEKERLAALVNSMQDEIWFADTRKRFTLANPAALEEFRLGLENGINVEEFAASLEVYRPDGSIRPVEESPALRALRGEVVRNQEEIIRTPASGALRYRQVNSSPVRDVHGSIIGSVSVVRDITEGKRMEEEINKKARQLEAANKELESFRKKLR